MNPISDADAFDTLDIDERTAAMAAARRRALGHSPKHASVTDGGETKVGSHAGSDLTMVDGLGGATYRRYAPTK